MLYFAYILRTVLLYSYFESPTARVMHSQIVKLYAGGSTLCTSFGGVFVSLGSDASSTDHGDRSACPVRGAPILLRRQAVASAARLQPTGRRRRSAFARVPEAAGGKRRGRARGTLAKVLRYRASGMQVQRVVSMCASVEVAVWMWLVHLKCSTITGPCRFPFVRASAFCRRQRPPYHERRVICTPSVSLCAPSESAHLPLYGTCCATTL